MGRSCHRLVAARSVGRSIHREFPISARGTGAGLWCHRQHPVRSAEGRIFHGYYASYCYLPLYVFCGQQLLCASLRPSLLTRSDTQRPYCSCWSHGCASSGPKCASSFVAIRAFTVSASASHGGCGTRARFVSTLGAAASLVYGAPEAAKPRHTARAVLHCREILHLP